MKTEVEINGFEISIEDIEGKISVKVEINDEVVEELSLDPAEYEVGSEEDEDELKAFGDEEGEGEVEGEEGEGESESMPEEEEEGMMGESIKTFDDMFPVNESK